jgi:hypothetical protein
MGYVRSLKSAGLNLVDTTTTEQYVPLKEPLVSLYLFKNRNFVVLTMVSGVGAMIFYALNLTYPQQIASVWGEDSVSSGWLTVSLPFPIQKMP